MKSIQFYLTPAAGKRLIAKGLAAREDVREALRSHTVVVIAGTTNGYAAEELLALTQPESGFDRRTFYRGIIKPGTARAAIPPLAVDVVLERGRWARGKTIFDAAPTLGPGDLILKGANAVCLSEKTAAVLIGNPAGGTMAAITTAVLGRRAALLLPVGVEKRVEAPLSALCAVCADPEAEGLRLWPAPGEAFTELDALRQLAGVEARIFAAGGVCGAEGGCYFLCTGTDARLAVCRELVRGVIAEPPYTLD